MAPPDERSGPGPIDRALRQLLADEQHRDEVAERRRRGALRAQADEVWTLVDVLRAAAVDGVQVELHAGPVLTSGTICELGRDYVAVRTSPDAVHLVPTARITEVGPLRGPGVSAGLADPVDPAPAPAPAEMLDLGERLRELARRRVPVAAVCRSRRTAGVLASVGDGVIAITGSDGGTRYLAMRSIDVIDVRG